MFYKTITYNNILSLLCQILIISSYPFNSIFNKRTDIFCVRPPTNKAIILIISVNQICWNFTEGFINWELYNCIQFFSDIFSEKKKYIHILYTFAMVMTQHNMKSVINVFVENTINFLWYKFVYVLFFIKLEINFQNL